MAVIVKKKKGKKPVKSKSKTKSADVSALGKAIRMLGTAGGSALGSYVGNPLAGGQIGNSLAAALSKWIGAGDYEVANNTFVKKAAADIPLMHKTDQSVVIRHKEYIGPINANSAFTQCYAITLNPGLQQSFPWLSNIACGFQQYNFKGVVFHYVPTSGHATGANTALGSVMFQTSYRANDSAPNSKIEMMNEYWANEVVPSETAAHPIECSPKENPFQIHYVRSGSIPSGDYLLYDYGVTYVYVSGCQGTNVLGDLWVSYEVELKKPMVSSNVLSFNQFAGLYFNNNQTPANMFTAPVTKTVGNFQISTTGRTIIIPQGTRGWVMVYANLMHANSGGTSLAWTGNPTLTNATLDTGLDGQNSVWAMESMNAPSGQDEFYACCVKITDPSVAAQITLPSPTTVTNLLAAAVTVWNVPF